MPNQSTDKIGIPVAPSDCFASRHLPAHLYKIYDVMMAFAKAGQKSRRHERLYFNASIPSLCNALGVSARTQVDENIKELCRLGWCSRVGSEKVRRSSTGQPQPHEYDMREHAEYAKRHPDDCPPYYFDPETGEPVDKQPLNFASNFLADRVLPPLFERWTDEQRRIIAGALKAQMEAALARPLPLEHGSENGKAVPATADCTAPAIACEAVPATAGADRSRLSEVAAPATAKHPFPLERELSYTHHQKELSAEKELSETNQPTNEPESISKEESASGEDQYAYDPQPKRQPRPWLVGLWSSSRQTIEKDGDEITVKGALKFRRSKDEYSESPDVSGIEILCDQHGADWVQLAWALYCEDPVPPYRQGTLYPVSIFLLNFEDTYLPQVKLGIEEIHDRKEHGLAMSGSKFFNSNACRLWQTYRKKQTDKGESLE